MKKTCLITGAGGFVGAAAAHRFLAEGYEVTVLLRPGKRYWRLSGILDRLTVVEGDLTDPAVVDRIAGAHPRYIYHFATFGAYPQETDLKKMTEVNILGTERVLDAARQSETALVINTGSSSEYGIKDAAMRETDLPEPVNEYGVTKTAATLLCQKTAKRTGLSVITFRLFSTYGPFEEKRRLIPTLMLGALSNAPISLSSPDNVRDYVYLGDVLSAYVAASGVRHEPGAVYNIGTGNEYRTKDIAETVLRITGSASKPSWNTVAKQDRQMEPKHWKADAAKAARVFGWKPAYDLTRGLTETAEWYKKNTKLYE